MTKQTPATKRAGFAVKKSSKHIHDKESELQKQLAGKNDQLLRLHAEFENFTKRTEKEKSDLRKFGSKNLILKLLDINDNFERALQVQGDSEEVKKGVEMIHKQLSKTLQDEGIESIESIGENFDPSLHEVIKTENGEEDKVVQELQKGYSYHGLVLRPAKVIISKEE